MKVEWAAAQAEASPENCLLIAAHPWDIAGAGWAGRQTVYLQRIKTPPSGLAKAPHFTIGDLAKLPELLR